MKENIAVKILKETIKGIEHQREVDIALIYKEANDKLSDLKKALSLINGINVLKENQEILSEQKKRIRNRKQKEYDLNTYPLENDVLSKMKFILRKEDRFMDLNEIADEVKKYEPNLDIEDIKTKFGKHINLYRQRNEIVTDKTEGSKYIYIGLPSFMQDGKILEKYEPL
jgi:hypothetical protein